MATKKPRPLPPQSPDLRIAGEAGIISAALEAALDHGLVDEDDAATVATFSKRLSDFDDKMIEWEMDATPQELNAHRTRRT